MSKARTSPDGPGPFPSGARSPMMIRFLYMTGGEDTPALAFGRPFVISGVFKIDDAVHAELGVERAGLGIEREQSWRSTCRPRSAGGSWRRRRSTRRRGWLDCRSAACSTQTFLARHRVERDHLAIGRRDIHHAVHDERRDLGGGKARVAAAPPARAAGGGKGHHPPAPLGGVAGPTPPAGVPAARTGARRPGRPRAARPPRAGGTQPSGLR